MKPTQHPDDAAVDRFATAMKHKLAIAREKGRGGWQGCDPADLSRMLREHVEKGDPRDVANFCMFLWHDGTGIAAKTDPRFTSAPEGWYFVGDAADHYGPYPSQLEAAIAFGGYLEAYHKNPWANAGPGKCVLPPEQLG